MIYTILMCLSLWNEPSVPFSEPVEGRPCLCQGNVPFPAPEVFEPETAKEVREAFGIRQLVFVQRATFQSSHYYTDFIDGCRFFGTDLCILDLETGAVRGLLPESMKSGIVNRFDVSYDAKRIVFDFKADAQSGFHLWEIGVDGQGLRQITFPPADEAQTVEKYLIFPGNPHHWVRHPESYPVPFGVGQRWSDDLHPCYLPDGGIAFVSTRCQHGILCDGDDILSATVLYRVEPDGRNMMKLSNSSVSEANPVVMEDGRILYTRWEYVDKGGSCVKCLWAMKVDGSASVEVFGNDHAMPPSLIHGRQVPGNPHLFVATAAPHCPQTGVGTLLKIDTTRNIRTEEPLSRLTPETQIKSEGDFIHPDRPDAENLGPFFLDPYPLDENRLLMSAQLDPGAFWYRPDGYGLCYYRASGDYAPIYRARGISCFQPVPLRPRTVPPVNVSSLDKSLAETTWMGQKLAKCVVTDVYVGLENVKRGEAKYLRVNEQLPRPWAARRFWGEDFRNHPGVDSFDQQHSPAGATHLAVKVQWGIVPLAEDGSAYFYVPADRNIFFQVLDENFQEIQRERTYVNYRPGETRACIGCHETAQNVPAVRTPTTPLALTREPVFPQPQPGEARGTRCLSFVDDIQPIFDTHCVSCHDGDYSQDGHTSALDLRGTPTTFFNTAYESLVLQKSPTGEGRLGVLIREIHPKVGNAEYLPARSLGSGTAPLVKLLRAGHYDVHLSPEEWIRLNTWIDSNAQYYGSYWGAKNLKFRDLPNFRPRVTFEEAISKEE